MLKTSAKIFLVFVLLVVVALATGFVTYILTRRVSEEDSVKTVEAAETEDEKTETVEVTVSEREPQDGDISQEYYTVRLEGTTLGVYAINDGKEEFLYHADVYKNDLSADDLVLLQQGVKLMNMSELTGFIENFTS